MSLLTIIQDAADLIGIPRPQAVFSSTDTQVRQLLALAQQEGRVLSQRHDWTALVRETTFSTTGAESQGEIATLAPGLRFQINETNWNRSQLEPLGGPLNAQEWQTLKGFTVTGPYSDYRIRGGELLLIPAPGAGETIALEYLSQYWCQSSGGTDQTRWAADGDTPVLAEDLFISGIRWRFLRAKGMDYAEEFREYELQVSSAIARDGSRRTMHLDAPHMEDYPVVRAPIGSWNL